jgi:hypothetical protein
VLTCWDSTLKRATSEEGERLVNAGFGVNARRMMAVRSRLGVALSVAALASFVVASPAGAGKPLIGDDGTVRSGSYVEDVVSPLKARLLELHGRQLAGNMTVAEADEWNTLIVSNNMDPLGHLRPATASSGAIVPMSAYASKDLTGTQRSQTKSYYCGPAAAYSVIMAWHNEKGNPTVSNFDHVTTLSQAHLGTSTYTNADAGSTDWVDKDMLRALNRWLVTPVAYVQITPTSIQQLEDKVTLDIDIDWMMASDMSEVAGGAHYNHHPDKTIYHWTSIRGYEDSGNAFHFQDPAANTTVLPPEWGSVLPYFTMSSTSTYTFMTRNVSRGITW